MGLVQNYALLHALKHEIEAKERSASVGLSSFEKHKRKANKESYSTCASNSFLQRSEKKRRFVYSVTQNNTLSVDVQNT